MAALSIAKSNRKTTVTVDQVACAGSERCYQMRAFLNGAISILKCSDAWEASEELTETVLLIEAAIEMVEQLYNDFDQGLLIRAEARHG